MDWGLGKDIVIVRLHNLPSDSLTNREYDYEKHSSGRMRMMRQALVTCPPLGSVIFWSQSISSFKQHFDLCIH